MTERISPSEMVTAWCGEVCPLWLDLDPAAVRFLSTPLAFNAGVMAIAEDLQPSDLDQVPVLAAARRLLQEIEGKGGLKLTAKGCFTRAVVSDLLDRLPWPDFDKEHWFKISKILNEEDVTGLHYLHLLLYEAGLVRRYKGTLKCSRLGRALMDDDSAGELMALLFETTYRELNLAYFDRRPLDGWPQDQLVLVLLLLSMATESWQRSEVLLRQTVYPTPELFSLHPRLDVTLFDARILRVLEWFGLLQVKSREVEGEFFPFIERSYRKTPLYDRFLRFGSAAD